MTLWIIFICALIPPIVALLILGWVWHKKINKGKIKNKLYIQLTMWTMIASFISVLVLSETLILNAYNIGQSTEALQIQAEGLATINPDLIIKLDEEDSNKFFFSSNIVGLSHDINWTFWPNKLEIDMFATNNGQRSTENINLYLKDSLELFQRDSLNKKIDPFDFEYFEFNLRYKKCYGGEGKEEYYKRREQGCDYKKVNTGLRELILMVDCDACQFERNPKCYSFEICIYNEAQQKEWCKEKLSEEDFSLKEKECPENYF